MVFSFEWRSCYCCSFFAVNFLIKSENHNKTFEDNSKKKKSEEGKFDEAMTAYLIQQQVPF